MFFVWSADGLVSLDVDGDGISGARMVDEPFPDFSPHFTPEPAYSAVPSTCCCLVIYFGSFHISKCFTL